MKPKKRKHLWILSLWLIGAGFLLTSHKETNASPTQSQSDLIAGGSRLFTPTCSNGYCHGKDGTGGNAPTLRGKSFSPEYLLRIISNGVPGTPMPSFKNTYTGK